MKKVDRLITRLGRLEAKGAVQFGKSIRVSETCTGCGWCEGHCPVSNIRLVKRLGEDLSRPEFGKTCDFCLGCLYGCPEKSLSPGKMKFAVIPSGYPLAAYQEASEQPMSDVALKTLLKAWTWSGVRRYLGV